MGSGHERRRFSGLKSGAMGLKLRPQVENSVRRRESHAATRSSRIFIFSSFKSLTNAGGETNNDIFALDVQSTLVRPKFKPDTLATIPVPITWCTVEAATLGSLT